MATKAHKEQVTSTNEQLGRASMVKQTLVFPHRTKSISLIAVRKPTRRRRFVHNKLLACHEEAYMATKAHIDRQVLRVACSYRGRS